MKKINLFYTSHDRSHCGSCWERSDEDIQILFTDLTVDEIKEKFQEYYWQELFFEENYEHKKFLKWLDEKAYDADNEKQLYLSIYYENEGTTYPPDCYSNSLGETHDLSKLIKPEEIVGIEEWDKLKISWAESKAKRLQAEEDRKKVQEVKDKQKAEYETKLKEYNKYLEMKEKWEGKNPPEKPVLKLSKFEEIMEEVKAKQAKAKSGGKNV